MFADNACASTIEQQRRQTTNSVISPKARIFIEIGAIEEFHIFRLAGGKIVEQWGMPDVQGLMTQLNASSVDKKRIP